MNIELDIVRDLSERLTRAEIPFMLTGSMAMNAYAEPRMTRDVDVVIEVQSGDTPRLLAAFSPDYYIDAAAVSRALASEGIFNVIHQGWIFKVDCIVRKSAPFRVAYHDPCHALRVLKIHEEPRSLLRLIPGLELVEISEGDRCCGAAGLYNVTQPELSSSLRRQKAEAVRDAGATTVATANPGCTMQLILGLKELGVSANVVHPIELLDRALLSPVTSGR